MQRTDRIDGSPRDEACTNIDSHGTANNSSPSGVISPTPEKRMAGVVPLYLVQQVVAAEIGRHGPAARETHIVRIGCHHHTGTTLTGHEVAGHD